MVSEKNLQNLNSFPPTERGIYFATLVSVQNLATEKMILRKFSNNNQ